MTLKFQAVLFDLDGTLLSTAGDVLAALKKTLNSDAIFERFTESEIHAICAYGSKKFYELASDRGIELPNYTTFKQRLFQHYQQQTQPTATLFSGIDQVIQGLDKHQIPWGIVTNKQRDSALVDVKRHSILQNCQIIVGFDTAAYPKPAPEPILYACDKLNITPEKTVFVGDTMVDMEAAYHAGSIRVGVTYGHGDFVKGIYAPQHVITSPEELLSLLDLH